MGLKNSKGDSMTKRILISARIDEKDAEEIDGIIKKTGGDLSSVIRNIIGKHFGAIREKRLSTSTE